MKGTTKDGGAVKTTEKSFEILERLLEMDGATLTELVEQMETAKSTIHRHLRTLEDMEYVVREGNTYYIGLRFLKFGEHARTRKEVYRMAEPKVRELADETGERAQFVAEEHGNVIFIHKKTGEHAVSVDSGIGETLVLHGSAAGKVVFAHMEEPRRSRLLESHPLPQLTEHTITDPDRLREEFAKIREQGYSLNCQESVDGLNAIGVPVCDADGRLVGAFSVSGPTHRLQGEVLKEELLSLLLGTANELELNITYS